MLYHVVVKKWKKNELVETVTKEPLPKHEAERVERGLNINLNHDEYYTDLVEVKEE